MVNGITVVSPMWGERSVTDRMVFSVIHQYIDEREPFKIHLVLVDDYIEGRLENGESYYSYYLSEEFKQFYNPDNIKITIIKNEVHKYQGESREIGFMAGDYPFFLLVDCDDMLSPNACDRYLDIINEISEDKENDKKIACVQGMVYAFDSHGFEKIINGDSIWVQSRCFNRDFIVKHGIHFPTGLNSKQAEDYPFIMKFDYVIDHDEEYGAFQIPFGQGKDCQCTAFWFPNHDSLSRKDPHYGQHLSGWTLGSSNNILDFLHEFNAKNGFEDEEDEFMKHKYLSMTASSFYNLLDFLKEISIAEYVPLEEDWYELRNNCKKLRDRLLEKYYSEIVYSDIEDILYHIKHFEESRFTESWIGTFYDYMNEEHELLRMTYEEMMEYAGTLEFDSAGHEIHSPQVQAWLKRHPEGVKKLKKDE